MTCHHGPGDTQCSSHPINVAARERERAEEEHAKKMDAEVKRRVAALTPDAANFEIVDVVRVGPHLVMKVQYPNCAKCSYEGQKVMVFLNVKETEVIRWRVIDPHFRDPGRAISPKEAPGPAARFPASKDGWQDALDYAHKKAGQSGPE